MKGYASPIRDIGTAIRTYGYTIRQNLKNPDPPIRIVYEKDVQNRDYIENNRFLAQKNENEIGSAIYKRSLTQFFNINSQMLQF